MKMCKRPWKSNNKFRKIPHFPGNRVQINCLKVNSAISTELVTQFFSIFLFVLHKIVRRKALNLCVLDFITVFLMCILQITYSKENLSFQY